jgi:hypothetical protein
MRFTRLIGAALGALAAVTLAAAPAFAAEGQSHVGRQATEMTCAGQPVTLLVAPGNGGDNWGAATIVDAGTLIPKTLEYLVYDDTIDATLDDDVISHGSAHAQQSTITCEVSERDVLGNVLPAGMELPPGTAATDAVTLAFRVVAVPRP